MDKFYWRAQHENRGGMAVAEGRQPFGKWRGILWPVYADELQKIGCMFGMFMCINFNYTLLRDTKDSLVVVAAGAEIIPFLKVWN